MESTLLEIYRLLAKNYGWSPRDIDETYLDTLFDFLLGRTQEDKDTRVINGRIYKRAKKGEPPAWL
jgi:hypothetical protein